MNSAPSTPLNLVSTEQIQKYLDENKNLIMAILESQNMGKVTECAQYQATLQKNLMYLAAIADAQPPGSGTLSQAPPTSPVPQAQMQAQHGGPVPKVPFQVNAVRPQDQHFQQVQGQFSGANNNGLHFLVQPGLGGSGGGSREGHGSLGLGHVESRD
ncbi:GRF1-interacting factor 3 [Striga hermonthica]|uniref:GRF1-interacting factor 3 n=1 Tax=Striga hermonthica TaxID=68872 RepID=A0A9N7NTI2_STRHE|nr:GRF1-interacting factor 3 [Striga hermonthica]